MIEVIEPGPFACVQDHGRTGYAALGVARAGAFDRAAHDLANRLVGNPPEAASIEFTLGGLEVLLRDAATVAVAGAAVSGLDMGVAVSCPAGTVVRFGTPPVGLRSYLAVRGGVEVDAVLGSRSTDTLGGLGPAALRRGDLVAVGGEPRMAPRGETGAVATISARPLRVVLGPRADWFTADSVATLTEAQWRVRPDSNRIGLRLDGPRLSRARIGELASEPTLPGAIQVPPDGQPILFGPDAPVTGGYPVIAVLRRRELDRVAQLRPGDLVQFSS